MSTSPSHQFSHHPPINNIHQNNLQNHIHDDPDLALSPLDKLVKHSRSLTVNSDKRFPTRSSSITNRPPISNQPTALSPSPSINRPTRRHQLHPQPISIPSSHSNPPSIFTPHSLQFNPNHPQQAHNQLPLLSPNYSDYRNSNASYITDRSDDSSVQVYSPLPLPTHARANNHHASSLPPNNQLPYNSPLSHLNAALDNPLPPPSDLPSPRRPSTGRVNSSTVMAQVQRELITSFYGDQQTISSDNAHHPSHDEAADHLEELRGPPTATASRNPAQGRQTWTSASSAEEDSELEGDSRYASGHSLSSEDPFQYWHYEASRQSRDAPTRPPIPASLHPALPASRSAGPSTPTRAPAAPLPLSTSDTALHRVPSSGPLPNFSRPLRSSAAHLDPSLPTPPPSREVSPRDTKPPGALPTSDDEAHALHLDTRALLARSHAPDAGPRTRTRSSIRSGSSVDTSSSTGSRRSWRNLFRRRSTISNCQDTEVDGRGNQADLPAITFSQPDHSRHIQAHASDERAMQHHYTTTNQRAQGAANKLEFNAPSPIHPRQQVQWASSAGPSHHPQPHTHMHTGDASQRLSIYSLPPTDDADGRLSVVAEQGRYMSRSPVFSDSTPRTPEAFGAQQGGARAGSRTSMLPSAMAKTKAHLAKTAAAGGGARRGRSAEEYLQAGIDAHEQGELERAAGLFERAAREGGGCGAGMLMWGLSLRHGWGCAVNEEKAFRWLQKAAESVVEDLEGNLGGGFGGKKAGVGAKEESVACKSELVLAIYELGMCFMRGWGCKKDKALAISYFELAARLGDPDAQQELGFCYANGKGTKKDLKKSAKYYRMASEQGVEMMGCQWIWKDKYNE